MKFCWLLLTVACAGCVKKSDPQPRTAAARADSTRAHQPFGSHRFEYTRGSILPNEADQGALDQATASVYDDWKERYLKAGCGADHYRVVTGSGPRAFGGSEAQGYGMIVVALMAGHDASAKKYFDGMLSYFLAHQSALTEGLMARQQDASCRNVDDDNSLSGGDLDIAYALLLADRQWGSCGTQDYGDYARRVISAITRGELHSDGRYVLLGDWVDASNRALYDTARTSDFTPSYFRSYQRFMRQPWWLGVIDNGYWLLEAVQAMYSPEAGLLPDYVEHADSEQPRPAGPGFSENEDDHRYARYARRVPWRLGSDFLVSGDSRARRILSRLNDFIRRQTHDDPKNVPAGYALDGTPSVRSNSMAFTAPLGVSAMVDATNQTWLNAIWKQVADAPWQGFDDDTARLVSMLLMSNNWWPPEFGADPCIGTSASESG